MDWLIWSGAAISVAGMAGILWCAVRVARDRKAGLSDDALRARMAQVVAVNLGALGVSVIGLMCVVMGIALG